VGFAYGVLMAIVGYIAGGMTCWLASGRYRLKSAALCDGAASALVLWFSRYLRHDLCVLDYANFRIDPIEF
jgi:predicted membrane-bound mannosyltransferase